jgi:hypothetical protein
MLIQQKGDVLMELMRGKTRVQIFFGIIFLLSFFALAIACDVEPRKSDAELGLNPQQSAGRKIYDSQCDRCHEP